MYWGPVYTERQHQYSDVTLSELLRFLNKPSESLQNGLQPQWTSYDASVNADTINLSLTLSVNRP